MIRQINKQQAKKKQSKNYKKNHVAIVVLPDQKELMRQINMRIQEQIEEENCMTFEKINFNLRNQEIGRDLDLMRIEEAEEDFDKIEQNMQKIDMEQFNEKMDDIEKLIMENEEILREIKRRTRYVK